MRRDNRTAAVLILAAAFFLVFVIWGQGPMAGVPGSGDAFAGLYAEAPGDGRLGRPGATGPPSTTRFPGLPLDINTATRDELMTLPGIGVKTAERIIDLRVKTGGFTDLSDLSAIEWLGGGRLARLRGLVYVKLPGAGASEDPAEPGEASSGR